MWLVLFSLSLAPAMVCHSSFYRFTREQQKHFLQGLPVVFSKMFTSLSSVREDLDFSFLALAIASLISLQVASGSVGPIHQDPFTRCFGSLVVFVTCSQSLAAGDLAGRYYFNSNLGRGSVALRLLLASDETKTASFHRIDSRHLPGPSRVEV